MNFTQVCSQWFKSVVPIWDQMESIDRWAIAAGIAAVLLLIISAWQVL